jgi:undecaprenyl-diphosphatase
VFRPVLTAALWGLIQGLTEFLPVSSSGHLVLVPAVFGFEAPGLAASVMLHLGTLVAVVAYYRRDLLKLLHLRRDPEARRILGLLVIGSIPAAIVGFTLADTIDAVFYKPWLVAVTLMVTGVVLLFAMAVGRGLRRLPEGRWADALVVGLAQAFALLPGISRSGMTITAGMAQGFRREEAARYSFLLSIPAIAGAALVDGIDLAQTGGFSWELLVGMAVAAVVGYLAIAGLLRVLQRVGLLPFALYCLGAGAAAYFLV